MFFRFIVYHASVSNSSLIIFLCFEKYKYQAQATTLPFYSYTSFFERSLFVVFFFFLLFSISFSQTDVFPLILKISDYYIVIRKSSFTVRSHCYRKLFNVAYAFKLYNSSYGVYLFSHSILSGRTIFGV